MHCKSMHLCACTTIELFLLTSISFVVYGFMTLGLSCHIDPPVLKEAIVESVINQSQTVNMTCVYFGLPTPHVNWSRFDYNDLSNMEPKFIVYTSSVNASMGGVYTTSTLQVADVNETDTSNYTCTGVNQAHGAMTTADITTHSFEVLVQSKLLK